MVPILIAAASLAQAAACPAADLRSELIEVHEAARTAHLKGDASLMAAHSDDRITMADRGTVRVQTRQEVTSFFEGYFKRVRYGEWSDQAPPTVVVSPDGQLGSMAVAISARYTTADAPSVEKAFKSSWIATYRRVGCAWKMTGNASNIVQ